MAPPDIERGGAWRWVALAFVLLAGAAGAEPRAGLIWNRSGLPSVFPLQVQTDAGQDHYLTLHDSVTGDDVLAAYIRGGEFFRVLVPPGSFALRFASGEDWQGEEQLFGPETTFRDLPEPLTFRVEGRVKAGHLVDLRDQPRSDLVQDWGICQRLAVEFPPPEVRRRLRDRHDPGMTWPDWWREPGRGYPRFEVIERFCG